jgi:predicted DNA binding CopG/RHH family protein
MKNEFAYDNEELALLREMEGDVWVDAPLSEEELDAYAQSAAYTKTLNEKRQTTIRFSVRDLAIIKAKAKEMGIGYQNLIQQLVHNYAHGKTKLEM